MKPSTIGWCDYSGGILNVVSGCTPVSEGCRFCYARRIYERFGRDFSNVQIHLDKLERLLKWHPKPPYKREGDRPIAYLVDTGDLFHEAVPDQCIWDTFQVMCKRRDIDFVVLTKRSDRLCRLLQIGNGANNPHIWLGVSVENQDTTWRIDDLMIYPGPKIVSVEPCLGPVDLRRWLPRLSWTLVGAESGPKRRPFQHEWAWGILDQCRASGTPCFLKQDSAYRPGAPLLDREGQEVKEWPGRG